MRLAFLLLVLIGAPLPAQDALKPGALVRLVKVEKYDLRRQGYVVSLTTDSALVRLAPVPEWRLRGDLLEIPLQGLEVRTAIRRRTKGGALIGGLVGAAVGLRAAYGVGDLCEGNPYYGTQTCQRDTSADVPLTAFGAVVGAGFGAIIGWLARSETWASAVSGR